jgi:hypothetical protein
MHAASPLRRFVHRADKWGFHLMTPKNASYYPPNPLFASMRIDFHPDRLSRSLISDAPTNFLLVIITNTPHIDDRGRRRKICGRSMRILNIIIAIQEEAFGRYIIAVRKAITIIIIRNDTN